MYKKIISLTLVLAMLCTGAFAAGFSDVEGHWAQATIEELAGQGIINGKGDGTFDPEGPVTRAEFIKLLVATGDATLTAVEGALADVPADAWFNPYVYAALEQGVFAIEELAGNAFSPNEPADRETVALWAVRLLEIEGGQSTTPFVDDADITNKAAVAAAYESGIITGDAGANTFRPKDTLTRAEAAVIIKRVMAQAAPKPVPAPAISVPEPYEARPTKPVTATVALADDKIEITGEGAFAEGSVLTITAGGVYELSGKLSAGQILIDAPKDETVELVLSGVDITAGENAAIYCKAAEDLIITLTENTQNTITDAADFVYADALEEEPNAALFSDADLNIGGSGALCVNAGFNHGIRTKDDLVIEGGSLTVTSTGDAIRGKDSIAVLGGTFNLVCGGDGFQSNNANSTAYGWVYIGDGSFTIKASGDAVQAESSLTIDGGTFDIVTEGTPTGTSDSQKGLKCGTLLSVNGGEIHLNTKDDGLNSNAQISICGGAIALQTEDDAIRADETISITGGTVSITGCHEGIETGYFVMDGGELAITASNDSINLSGVDVPKAEILGGFIYLLSSGGGIDAGDTGSASMSGGTLIADASITASPTDYLGGLAAYGGTLLAIGCKGDVTMPCLAIPFAEEVPANTKIVAAAADGTELYSYTSAHGVTEIEFASDLLQLGQTYTISTENGVELEIIAEEKHVSATAE